MLQNFGWLNWTEARMAAPNTALVFRVAGFQPEVGTPWLLLSSSLGAVASTAAVDLSLPQTRGPRSFFAHRELWGALAVWVCTSMLLEPTWQVSNIPRWWSSGHMTDSHLHTHTSNNSVFQLYRAEIVALFVVHLPNPCKSSSGSLLWLLNGIKLQNHRHGCAL